jgi:macrolide transport system ATP-binding/permease protein
MRNGWIWRLRSFAARVLGLFASRKRDSDFDQEVQSHLQMLADHFVAQGMSREDAAAAARRQFGNATLLQDGRRELRTLVSVEDLGRDVRYGLRQLRRNPWFTAVAVITLALGIGANAAVFTLIDTVLLRNLPVNHPQQLVLLEWAGGFPRNVSLNITGPVNFPFPAFSYPAYLQFSAKNRVFSDMFGFAPAGRLRVNSKGEVSQANGTMVTGQLFSTLGVVPHLGRAISGEDEKPGAPAVAVLSYAYWTRQFARSRSVLGKTVALNGALYTIVGVTPKDFFGVEPGDDPDFYIPLTQNSHVGPFGRTAAKGQPMLTDGHHWWLMIMGRLKPGVSRKRALAELSLSFMQGVSELQKAPLKPDEKPYLIVTSGGGGYDVVRSGASEPLLTLMAIVVLLLLAACANVATLLVARSAMRRKEVAVRLALGASRSRLIRQLLTESVMLAAMGGALGLLVAYWGARALGVAWMARSVGMTMTWSVTPNVTVLVFTAAVSLITGILFGLAPAFRGTRMEVAPALKGNARSVPAEGRHRGLGLGKGWVTAQVAISLILLISAGLFVRTLDNLEKQDFGFNARHLLIFSVDPTQAGYQGVEVADFYSRMRQRIQALAGVESVTYSGSTPLFGDRGTGGVSLANKAAQAKAHADAQWTVVGPDFLRTMQIQVLRGRDIQGSDTASAPYVAVVNEAMAHAFFGKRNPIGHRIRFTVGPRFHRIYRIAGLAASAKDVPMDQRPPPAVYFPLSQTPLAASSVEWEIRTIGRPTLLAPAVRHIVYQLDPNVPLTDVETETDVVAQSTTSQRMFSKLSSFFGLLALLLAAIGLNGVVSYAVKRRTNEIGIRMALGATQRNILAMVLRETLVMVLIGVGIGIPAVLELTRFIKSQLYGVKPTDPLTLSFAVFLMVVVALLSSYLPARRASRVDPTEALRHEHVQ